MVHVYLCVLHDGTHVPVCITHVPVWITLWYTCTCVDYMMVHVYQCVLHDGTRVPVCIT